MTSNQPLKHYHTLRSALFDCLELCDTILTGETMLYGAAICNGRFCIDRCRQLIRLINVTGGFITTSPSVRDEDILNATICIRKLKYRFYLHRDSGMMRDLKMFLRPGALLHVDTEGV